MISPSSMEATVLRRQIKILLILFIVCLAFSGLTAFPIEWQLGVAKRWIEEHEVNNTMSEWLLKTYNGVHQTNQQFSFIAYGTDWLAFAHLVIAVGFVGPLRDPTRNIWVLEFGIIACAGIIPLAMIAGEVRDIPFFWRVIDCSFGIFGGALLWWCRTKIVRLENIQRQNYSYEIAR